MMRVNWNHNNQYNNNFKNSKSGAMKRFTFLPRVILGLLLFVTGGGISLAADTYVTNTVNGKTYTFKIGTNNTVTLSKIGDTDLKSYTGTDIDLLSAYPKGTFTSTDGSTTYTITSMEAMRGNTTIKTVEMPSTVTSLPKYCFSGCTALTTVSFPGIQTIGNYAFQDCSALTGITIPEGVTVGEKAFQNCTGLTGELTIPKGTYNNLIFDGCTNVTDLVIHTGVNIKDWDKHGCFGIMQSVTNVTLKDDGDHTIPAYLFGCASFKDDVTLDIDKSITGIGDYAFYKANFPKTLDLSKFKSFGTYAFANNRTITGNNGVVTFADNAKFTGEQTFLNCTALSGTLTIPNGANIPYRAFDGCSSITSIVLHSGMTSREYNRNGCFMSMSGVNSVSIIDDGNHTIPANVFGGASFKDGVTLDIDKNITGIGAYAFYNANFPTTLDLSSQFTSYGVSAFEDNKAFQGNDQKVIAVKPSGASSVTVGSKAFWNTQATEIDIYPNVSYSGCEPSDAYYSNGAGPYNGKNITKVVFENSVTSIPDYLFLHASDIPLSCTINWPTDLTNIGKGAFCGVQFKAAIPKEMSGEGTIGEYAYAHNGMSDEITIPSGCTGIGASAFYDCDKIKSVTVPASTTSIGKSAFSDCALLAELKFATLTEGTEPNLVLEGSIIDNDKNMKGITITNAVKTIYYSHANSSNNTFSGLTSPFTVTLKSDKVTATRRDAGGTFFSFKNIGTTTKPNTLNVEVADGVTTIPADMFSENPELTRTSSNINVLKISGNNLTEIKSGAFQNNQELTSVDLSGAPNLKKIDSNAFSNCSMTSINFGTNCDIDTIGTSAFESCKSLATITIGKVKTLGECAFNNCAKLANINQTSDGKNDLRNSTLTSIGLYTFGGCTALDNLYLPSTLMRINAAAFVNSGGEAAGLVTKDAAYIETSAGHCFNTFCRGFDVNVSKDMNTTVNTNNTATVWAVTGIDKTNRKAVLQQVTTSAPSSESYLNGYIIYNSVNDSTSTNIGYKTSTDKLNLHLMFNNDSHNVIENANNTKNGNMMKGVIDAKTFSDANEASRCYVIWGRDQKLHPIKQGTTLAAGKAYIDPGTSGNGAKFDGFSFFFSSEPFTPTAINAVKANADSHSAAHDNDDSYYDLQGRKVEFPSTGIYIHHGRKVVITHKPLSLNL